MDWEMKEKKPPTHATHTLPGTLRGNRPVIDWDRKTQVMEPSLKEGVSEVVEMECEIFYY